MSLVSDSWSYISLRDGNGNKKGASLSDLAFDVDSSCVFLDDLIADRQAKPCPFSYFFRGKKGFKDLLLRFLGDPDSRIGDCNFDPSPLFRERRFLESAGFVMVKVPPCGMASRALVMRLRKRVWRWVGSPRIGGRSGEREGGELHISCMKPGFTQTDQVFQDFVDSQAVLTGVWVDG